MIIENHKICHSIQTMKSNQINHDSTRIPLHYAAEYNQLEIVKFYIEEAHFDDIDIQDIPGNTSMNLACINGNIRYCEVPLFS